MTEPLSEKGPWRWSCPKCRAEGVFATLPQPLPGSTLNCSACVLAGRGLVVIRVEEVPRGLPN